MEYNKIIDKLYKKYLVHCKKRKISPLLKKDTNIDMAFLKQDETPDEIINKMIKNHGYKGIIKCKKLGLDSYVLESFNSIPTTLYDYIFENFNPSEVGPDIVYFSEYRHIL